MEFTLFKLRKNQHHGPLKTFVIARLIPDSRSCRVACMPAFLIKSFDFRSQGSRKDLLLVLKTHHNLIGVSTVARLIKDVLASSGIEFFFGSFFPRRPPTLLRVKFL